jgi:hypothetical protein
MALFCSGLAALAVALLYYAYRDHRLTRVERARRRRDRVAFLLWAAANPDARDALP